MARKAAIAILVCAVMVLVAAAPLALASTHTVIKGDKGPRASAVTWEFAPPSYGLWTGHISNSGLRSLMVDVYDITAGAPAEVMHQTIRFAAYDAYPTGVVDTASVVMGLNHLYSITVTPNGPKGSYCTVDDRFQGSPPISIITIVSVDYLRVVVDGSNSNSDGTIVSYSWDFGDGSGATGVTATHTYAAEGTYTITLTVMNNGGLTSSSSEMVTVHRPPLLASFTYTAHGLTVNVDASSSSSAVGIVRYDWNWGDGTTGNGMIASHTYATARSVPIGSGDALLGRGPPFPHAIFGYTYAADGVTVLPGCDVTITDLRTGESVYTTSDPVNGSYPGIYSIDMSQFLMGWAFGDVLNVTATQAMYIGWTVAPVTDTPAGYDQVDVVLHSTGASVFVTITLLVTDTMGQTDSVNHTIGLVPQPVNGTTLLYEPFDSYASLDPGWSFWKYPGIDYNHFEILNGTLYATNVPGLGANDSRDAFANWTGPIIHDETLSISFSIYLPTSSDYKEGDWGQFVGLYLCDTSGQPVFLTRWFMDQWSGAPSGWTYGVAPSQWARVCGFTSGWHQVEMVMSKTIPTWTAVFDGVSYPGLSYFGGSSFGFDISKLSFWNGLREEVAVVMIDDLLIKVNEPLPGIPPVALASINQSYQDVTVDGSGSYDPDGTIVSYEWTFGDGSSATGVTATHTYAAAGTYRIILTVTDNSGKTGWTSQQVSVVSALQASFNYTVNGLTVNVDASSSSSAVGIVSYQWSWGDGTTGNGMVGTHTYPASVNSTPAPPYHGPPCPPHAIFGYIYTAGGVPLLTSCNVTIVHLRTGYSYTTMDVFSGVYSIDAVQLGGYWMHGDLIRVTATSGTQTGWTVAPLTDNPMGYDQMDVVMGSGVVTVALGITDALGQTASVSHTVKLVLSPIARFTLTMTGLTVNVDASSSTSAYGIVSYAWDWGDGTTGTGVTATHTYSTVGSVMADSGYALSSRAPDYNWHTLFGFTYAADGVTLLPGCDVTITDTRTGESISTISDLIEGIYLVDLSSLVYPWVFGDIFNVTATKGTMIGWTEAPITDTPGGYDQIDVVVYSANIVVRTVTLTITDTMGQTSTVSRTVTRLI